MKNERISRIYIFYVNEFKLAHYARDTGKVSLFYNKRKTTKRVFGFMEVKKFLDILFMKRYTFMKRYRKSVSFLQQKKNNETCIWVHGS